MKMINNLSDVEIIVGFLDEAGEPAPIPEYDFELSCFVKENKVCSAGKKNGIYDSNIIVDGDKLHLFFDKPLFGKGRLRSRKTYCVPSQHFPDRVRTIVVESITNIVID